MLRCAQALKEGKDMLTMQQFLDDIKADVFLLNIGDIKRNVFFTQYFKGICTPKRTFLLIRQKRNALSLVEHAAAFKCLGECCVHQKKCIVFLSQQKNRMLRCAKALKGGKDMITIQQFLDDIKTDVFLLNILKAYTHRSVLFFDSSKTEHTLSWSWKTMWQHLN